MPDTTTRIAANLIVGPLVIVVGLLIVRFRTPLNVWVYQQ
jgi:hypothetical protein